MTELRAITCVLFVMMTSTTAGADRKQRDETYCSALSAVSADLAQLEAIGPSATLGDLRATAAWTDYDTRAVHRAASELNRPTAKQLVRAVEHLNDATRSLPDSTTVDEARLRVGDDFKAAKGTARALADMSGCFEPMPTAEPAAAT